MSRGRQGALASVLGVAVALSLSTFVSAQECTIGADQLVGVLDNAGGCRGYDKQSAQKYLKVEVSQCQPSPKKGFMILGRCVADAPPLRDDEPPQEKEIRELRTVIIEMHGEIRELNNRMNAQYNELMGEIEYLKSELSRLRR